MKLKLGENVISFVDEQVDWGVEKNCIQTIAAALGNFYAMLPPMLPNTSGDGWRFYKKRKLSCAEQNSCNTTGSDEILENDVDHELLSEAELAWSQTQREWSIQHVLFPSLRLFFKPPASMATNGTFVQANIYL
ncbi:hypothetical protein K1719_043378 [Acacia pycnantha]|nr:hypothetical protein K1719_043378 [Acacia pycnantha]